MNNNNNNDSYARGLITGAFLGGAIGAVAALLFAPKSGEDLRRDLADKSQVAVDKAQGYISDIEVDLNSVVKSTVNEGKKKADAIIGSAKTQAEEIISNAEAVLSSARTKATSTKENVQNKISNVKDATNAGVSAFKDELRNG